MRPRKWSENKLREEASQATSVRQLLLRLGLVEAGGNYSQIKKYLLFYKIDTSHFTAKGWRKGIKIPVVPKVDLSKILINGSSVQSFKLKRRLFDEGLKMKSCEICGWAQVANDGRLPLELDHINGDKNDNRLVNLRVLCPNCHSLQPTHRGKNKKHY